MSERYDIGRATRRAVLGDAHVDRAEANRTALDEPFQTLITEGAWGSVWSRPQLTRRERSLITLALLAARGIMAVVQAPRARMAVAPRRRRRRYRRAPLTLLEEALPRELGS